MNNQEERNSYDYPSYGSVPRSHALNHTQDDYPTSTGYILKKDPRELLMEKEIQKQEYAKALRE